jgi:hypothetical protein
MYFRELSPATPARLALYYAFEAKYFGEDAPTVGWQTDLYIWRCDDEQPTKIDLRVIEDVLVKRLCENLRPRPLRDNHLKHLNDLPLSGFDRLRRQKRNAFSGDDEWIVTRETTP